MNNWKNWRDMKHRNKEKKHTKQEHRKTKETCAGLGLAVLSPMVWVPRVSGPPVSGMGLVDP